MKDLRSLVNFLLLILLLSSNFNNASFADGGLIKDSELYSTDSSCKGIRNFVYPVLVYASDADNISEQREVTLKMLSTIPCGQITSIKFDDILILLKKLNKSGEKIQEVVKSINDFFNKNHAELFTSDLGEESLKEQRFIFALMSEFYDNISLTIFEVSKKEKTIFLKITVKRDNWSEALSKLGARFANNEKSFLSSIDKTGRLRTVRVTFQKTRNYPTLERLNSELSASVISHYRNPLPLKFWERRSFFRLAEEGEEADINVDFNVEINGTNSYALVKVYTNDENAKTSWLEGTLASLPEFEHRLFNTSRDMLMDVAGIYDYTASFGPEFLLSHDKSPVATLWGVSLRHNRGQLAATLRLSVGSQHWKFMCGKRSTYYGAGALPGWQFLQTERVSSDVGIYVNAGLMDAAFAEMTQDCPNKKTTYGLAGYGTFAQVNYSSRNRLSALARAAVGGASMLPISSSQDEKLRSRTEVTIFLGFGFAL